MKESIASVDEALSEDERGTQYPLNKELGIPGTLVIGDQNQSTPSWVGLLSPYLSAPITKAYSANISAVLILSYEKRMFAITFGYGKGLLSDSIWVSDFGLKVTLNRVDPAKLRSIDAKTYEDLVRSTRTQTSRSSSVDSFQLDIARDLVRGVTGDSLDQTFFKRLTGADALRFTTPLPFADIGDILDELLVAYKSKTYRKHFSWIDNVREADASISAVLDSQIIEALRNAVLDGMHLAPSDLVDWENVVGFNFTRGERGAYYEELELDRYLEVLGEKSQALTLDELRRHKVRVRYGDSEELRDMWSVYDCLVWETELKGRTYALFDGRWFEIAADYATQVKGYVDSISKEGIQLPSAAHGPEAKYNASVEKAKPERYALLDRKMVRPAGGATPIEFCDLLSVEGHMIHVKKRSSSSTLSHLFAQGSVSCDLFLGDPTLRNEVRGKLRDMKKDKHERLITEDKPQPANFHVIYAVLAEPGKIWPPKLPFFSAVNLRHHASRIQNLGFEVSLQHVRQARANVR